MSRMSRGVLAAFAIVTVGLGLVPAVVLVTNVGWAAFIAAWHTDPLLPSALWTTLLSGVIALAVILVLAGPTVWYLARVAPPWVRAAGLGLVLVPLFMPPLVLGLVMAFVLGPSTGIGAASGHLGVSPTNSWFSLVVGEVYEALPYFVITAWAGLRSVSPALEEAALTLGRTPWATFSYVTLPLAGPSLVAAVAMTWSRVVGAFGAVVILAYHPTGLPVAIWIGLEELGLAQALPLALWLLVVGLPIPLVLAWRGERRVAIGR